MIVNHDHKTFIVQATDSIVAFLQKLEIFVQLVSSGQSYKF
jgi:hypothetical protein